MIVAITYLTICVVAASLLTVPRRRGVTNSAGVWIYTTNPSTGAGLVYQDVVFPARGDGTLIRGWYIPVASGERAIIFVHGKDRCRSCEFQGRAMQFLRSIHERGFALLTIDMRGHGASDGDHFSFGLQERRDIHGAVDWLLAQGFEPGKIGLLGVSMGAASSIGAAAEETAIGGLVADSSYADIYPVMQQVLGRQSRLLTLILPTSLAMTRVIIGVNIGAARPVQEIARLTPRSVLLIHGSRDGLIPVADAEQLHTAAPGSQLWIVPGAGHARAYASDPTAYVARVAVFFNAALR